MTASIGSALTAYQAAGRVASSDGTSRDEASGPGFGEVLEKVARDTVGTLRKSENLTALGLTGKADMTDVVQAVNNAEMTLQTVTAVRDKIVSAYQEILKMPM